MTTPETSRSILYIDPPTIPAGMTVATYRKVRVRKVRRLRRIRRMVV